MSVVDKPLSVTARQDLRSRLLASKDSFVAGIPKVELHIHIEGTLTSELRWEIAQRNGTPLKHPRTGTVYTSLEQLKKSYELVRPPVGFSLTPTEERFTFFEAYYGGFEVLVTKQDFYDLAMNYFEHAAAMNVRYCEPFFDPQGHTRRGVSWETFMSGFREAQIKAEKDLNVKSQWTMCMLRDMSPSSAMEHYNAALPYRDMIVAIGLDSDEHDRPPSLFEDVFVRAKADGFHLTCHCDVAQKDTYEHIRQVASTVGGGGAERIDHGLNAAERLDLMDLIRGQGVGMTICPWAYLRRELVDEVFLRIRTLYDAGIKVAIASDDPAYMEDCWILHNMLAVKEKCAFMNADIETLVRNSVEICWAGEDVKGEILQELKLFVASQ